MPAPRIALAAVAALPVRVSDMWTTAASSATSRAKRPPPEANYNAPC
jgi:hypothetical protein